MAEFEGMERGKGKERRDSRKADKTENDIRFLKRRRIEERNVFTVMSPRTQYSTTERGRQRERQRERERGGDRESEEEIEEREREREGKRETRG